MTSLTTQHPAASPMNANGIHFVNLLRSEWLKFRTLRSTWWNIAVAILFIVLFALIVSLNMSALFPPDVLPDGAHISSVVSPAQATGLALLSGIDMVAVVFAVLASLAITNEYSSGMIRTTFSAVPRRTPILLAKATVLLIVSAVLTLVILGIAYLTAMPGLSKNDLVASITDPVILKLVGNTAIYLSLLAVIALGVGMLIRHSAGAITAVIALLFVLPGILSALPPQWIKDLSEFFPSMAGNSLMWSGFPLPEGIPQFQPYSMGVSILILAGWAAGLFTLGLIRAKRTDA